MAATKLDALTKAYRAQVPLYEKMLTLAQEQGKCLSEGNYPILEEIAELRLRLQNEVSDLTTTAQQLIQEVITDLSMSEFNLSALRGKLPQVDVALLAATFEQITSTITAIRAEDERNMVAIKGQMDGVRGQFGEMDKARRAIRAYNPITPTSARFVDKRK